MQPTPMVEPLSAARHVLSVRDLVVDFVQDTGAVRALDGVSLDLHAGRVLGVVGESGCGKSVTARAILRLIDRPGRIAAGRVLLDPGSPEQQDLAALDPESRAMRAVRGGRIGLIFQEPMTALSVHYTVGNQIIEAIRAHSDFTKAAARKRGGGVRAFQRTKGVALRLITHDMGVIAQMADDVAVMYLGRIVEFAPVAELFSSPRHPYTRALLRSVPNLRAGPRERLATIGGAVPHPGSRPVGCPFHPRCPEVIAGLCATQAPAAVAPDQAGASCFHAMPETARADAEAGA